MINRVSGNNIPIKSEHSEGNVRIAEPFANNVAGNICEGMGPVYM